MNRWPDRGLGPLLAAALLALVLVAAGLRALAQAGKPPADVCCRRFSCEEEHL